jgi:hypothetical protein
MNERIDAAAVLAIARAQGHDWVDEAAAERIAAAATVAIHTIAAVLPAADTDELLAASPTAFADMLERLAGDEP